MHRVQVGKKVKAVVQFESPSPSMVYIADLETDTNGARHLHCLHVQCTQSGVPSSRAVHIAQYLHTCCTQLQTDATWLRASALQASCRGPSSATWTPPSTTACRTRAPARRAPGALTSGLRRTPQTVRPSSCPVAISNMPHRQHHTTKNRLSAAVMYHHYLQLPPAAVCWQLYGG